MRLGVMLGYFGAGTSAAEQLELVREAERLGYDSAWVAEAYGSDAATVLAWLAAQTGAIHLGSAVFQIPARSPAMAAMTAATLDQLSGGRFRLGLGLSGPQVAEGWHGQRFGRPLARTRDYLSVVRMALERRRVAYQGETLKLPLPDGPGALEGPGAPGPSRARSDRGSRCAGRRSRGRAASRPGAPGTAARRPPSTSSGFGGLDVS